MARLEGWDTCLGLLLFRFARKGIRSRFVLDIRIFTIFETLRFAASHGEPSYTLLSEARVKKAGYDSQVIRLALSTLVTAACPMITPYDWQVNLAKTLQTLGLDATVIAGTGSGKTSP